VGGLDCYGAEIGGLADLAGDFDFLSTVEREAWIARQWTEVAESMGWAGALEAAFERIRRTRIGLAHSSATAIEAYRQVALAEREEPALVERARVRQEVLRALVARSSNVWKIEVEAASLPLGICFGGTTKGGRRPSSGLVEGLLAKSGATTVDPQQPGRGVGTKPASEVPAQRAFLADSGPSYFWRPAPRVLAYRPGCGNDAPLRLALGTFPWVYGHRLQAPAPGTLWRSDAGPHAPAVVGLEIAASLWQPAGNLRQDAREVVEHWRHWRDATGDLVDAVPVAGEKARAGDCLYRRGHLLEVCQGSLELVGLNGPRGFICAAAFNAVQRRFAAFFAMRRALLRARERLPSELRRALNKNPDPCLRQQLNLTALLGA